MEWFWVIAKTVLILAAIAFVLGALLGIAGKIFAVKKDEREEKVLASLPGANCGACGFAAYWSVKQFLLLRKMGTMTTTLGKIPVYVLYIIVPLGLIMMTIRFLIQAFCRPIAIAAEGKGR